MNIVKLQGEANIEALLARIYGEAAKQRPELAERLVDANPHLANIAALPSNTPVIVPRTGIQPVDEASIADDPRRVDAIAQLTAALADLEKNGAAVLAAREDAFKQSVELAKREDVRAAAGEEFAAELDEVIEEVKRRTPELENDRKTLAAAIAAARVTIEPRGRRRVGGRPR
jgi:hypothetical protein